MTSAATTTSATGAIHGRGVERFVSLMPLTMGLCSQPLCRGPGQRTRVFLLPLGNATGGIPRAEFVDPGHRRRRIRLIVPSRAPDRHESACATPCALAASPLFRHNDQPVSYRFRARANRLCSR